MSLLSSTSPPAARDRRHRLSERGTDRLRREYPGRPRRVRLSWGRGRGLILQAPLPTTDRWKFFAKELAKVLSHDIIPPVRLKTTDQTKTDFLVGIDSGIFQACYIKPFKNSDFRISPNRTGGNFSIKPSINGCIIYPELHYTTLK